MGITFLFFSCNNQNIKDENHQQEQSKSQGSAEVIAKHETQAAQAKLHVPSPDWQDQIVYLLMIDRFNDGNISNSDQGVGVYEPGAKSKYNGGDLQGVIDKLDYLENLGVTAVWTTPHVANQWWDPIAQYWGYHGYWARDFKSVDEHYGTLADYQNLSRGLHARNMYLIQDVVVNHTGNFFYYDGEFDEQDVAKNFKLNTGSLPTAAASQFPLSLNNVNNAEHKLSNIFNWTPSIRDVSSHKQETTFQTAGLDDMNTKNPRVRDFLKDSFGYWIKQAGVDAFRIDTAKYVEKAFYEDFLHSEDGILKIAESTGRNDFLTFGEILEMSPPYTDTAEQKISSYLGTKENPRMAAAIGFPVYSDIKQVFAGGRPTSYLSYRVKAGMNWYKDPYKTVNFIDNHDVERFLANGTINGLKQAYTFLMSIPGIPAIYQGDEQAHTLMRQTMFGGGYGSEKDQFNQSSQMYQFIQKLTHMRLSDKVFSRGSIEFLQDNESAPGILAYKREYEGKEAYVIFNTGDETALLSRLPTSFWGNNEPEILLAENINIITDSHKRKNSNENSNKNATLPLAADGTLTMLMPARSVLIFSGASKSAPLDRKMVQDIMVNPIPSEFYNVKSASISGNTSTPNAELLRIIDGNIEQAIKFVSDSQGKWSIQLPIDGLGSHQHFVEIFWPEKKYVSNKLNYTMISSIVTSSAFFKDKMGDDKGLSGTYIKPNYQEENCYLDIESVQAKAGGDTLELTLKMCDISVAWAPQNGFDHLALTIYFDSNAMTGKRDLPLLFAKIPHNSKWDLAHSVFGWGNYVFGSSESTAAQEGKLINYTPEIEVNVELKEIKLTYRGKRLGVNNWQDTSVYITTWDKDEGGDYRRIVEQPSRWDFSDENQNSARIADAVYFILESK